MCCNSTKRTAGCTQPPKGPEGVLCKISHLGVNCLGQILCEVDLPRAIEFDGGGGLGKKGLQGYFFAMHAT